MSTETVKTAIAVVEKAYTDFEEGFTTLEADVANLSYPEVEDRLRALQAILAPATAQFNTIGGTGKREDVEAVNKLGNEFNVKSRKMQELGNKAHASQPQTRSGIRNVMKERTYQ